MRNDLTPYFETYNLDKGRATYKPLIYSSIYDSLLSKYRGQEVNLVELGVGYGGCLQMWKGYLGSKAKIYGLDHYDHLLFSEPQIECFLVDQSKKEDLDNIRKLIPKIDVFIDDGSHFSKDQIMTYETVFPFVDPGGLYIVEDTHTSYREMFGGGYKAESSFIEYCKNIVDSLHGSETEAIKPNLWINEIDSISFYRTMVVIKKSEG